MFIKIICFLPDNQLHLFLKRLREEGEFNDSYMQKGLKPFIARIIKQDEQNNRITENYNRMVKTGSYRDEMVTLL